METSAAEAHHPLPRFEANHSNYVVRKVFLKKINKDVTQREEKSAFPDCSWKSLGGEMCRGQSDLGGGLAKGARRAPSP